MKRCFSAGSRAALIGKVRPAQQRPRETGREPSTGQINPETVLGLWQVNQNKSPKKTQILLKGLYFHVTKPTRWLVLSHPPVSSLLSSLSFGSSPFLSSSIRSSMSILTCSQMVFIFVNYSICSLLFYSVWFPKKQHLFLLLCSNWMPIPHPDSPVTWRTKWLKSWKRNHCLSSAKPAETLLCGLNVV